MRPGLANAFLIGFIESMADFGNPLVIGGNFNVLSTEIFFAVVGAQHDQGRAAVLAIVLLVFTLGAFFAQRFWLGTAQLHDRVRQGRRRRAAAAARPARAASRYGSPLPWAAVHARWSTASIFVGGFVKVWGRDNTPTLDYYRDGLRRSSERLGG